MFVCVLNDILKSAIYYIPTVNIMIWCITCLLNYVERELTLL